MADIIDIDVFQTVTSVSFEVEPNTNIININKVTSSGGGGNQDLQSVTDVGSTTTNPITANSFVKSGGTGTNVLLDNGNTVALSSIGGATNLSPTQTATNFTINSDTGTDATIPLGNGTLAGATLNNYTTAEKTKLSGIATGAEVNVNADWNATTGDAQILNKPTISGTNTGDQNLQSVTNIDNTTTNQIISTTNIIEEASINGVSTSEGGYGVYGVANAIDGFGVYGNSNLGTGIYSTTVDGTAIRADVSGNGIGIKLNSVLASTGNFIHFFKNSVSKFFVTQNGYLTAEKIIKNGGSSSEFLMADGSVSSGGISAGISNSIASGTDTYTATITGVTSYVDGVGYLIRFTNGNTTTATLNINGLGARTLYRNNDGQLIGGDIQNLGEMLCIYSSALSAFKCIGTSPNDIIAYVTNADSVTITKGQPIYAFGGIGDRMTVKLAYNTLDATSAQTIGLVMSTSIAAGQKGYIITQGLLDGLSTLSSPFVDGDTVYLGATAGTITRVKPSAPNHLVYLGVVTTSSNGAAGRMYVRPQNGYELEELHNVDISSVANNQLLSYDSATSLWKNKSVTTADIAASTNKNYVTDAQATVIGNTSGTNTGDETTATIKTKLGITTLSGSNTGDQTLIGLGGVASNTAITGATNTKITYDSKGLVTAGTTLIASDIPTIAQSQVTSLTTDLGLKANLASPAFTGTPSLPTGTTAITQTAGDNSLKLATTAFVTTAVSAGGITRSLQEVTYTTNKIATVTAAEYAALTKDANTLYFITA